MLSNPRRDIGKEWKLTDPLDMESMMWMIAESDRQAAGIDTAFDT